MDERRRERGLCVVASFVVDESQSGKRVPDLVFKLLADSVDILRRFMSPRGLLVNTRPRNARVGCWLTRFRSRRDRQPSRP
jgi:hypothetical protein